MVEDRVAADRGMGGRVLVPDLLVGVAVLAVFGAVGAIDASAGLQPIMKIKPIIRVNKLQTPLNPVISCLDNFGNFIGPVYLGPKRSQDGKRWQGIYRIIFGQSYSYSIFTSRLTEASVNGNISWALMKT